MQSRKTCGSIVPHIYIHRDKHGLCTGRTESCSYMIATEQKARTTYDNILRLVHDSDVCDPIRFLRAREVVHFQRFGEALRIVQDKLDSKNFYAFNPEFDKCKC